MAQSRGERPLKNVAEAFEPLANSLNSHNSVLKVGPFVHASSFVVPLISVLDTTWKFAERDFAQKVNHLAANSDPTKTIEEIIVEDIQANNEREASSNTRYILKVKRGLDMLRVILEQIVAADFKEHCVKDAAHIAYETVFAQYITWPKDGIVSENLLQAVPTWPQLREKLNEDDSSSRAHMNSYTASSEVVINYINSLFSLYNVDTHWI